MPLRYAFRTLLKNPAFTVVAVLTLAIGIGANTAIFSVVNGVLLRPLPFKDAGRLAILWESRPDRPQTVLSAGEFLAWNGQNRTFDGMSALDYEVVNVTGRGEPVQAAAGFVSPNFFNLLGTRPALGRLLQPSDSDPGHEHVVVISHALWQQHFGSDPSILGRSINVDDAAYTVVGVLPRGFTFWNFSDAEIWAPFVFPKTVEALHNSHHLNAVGRLKPDVTLAAAQRDLSAVEGELARQYPGNYTGYGAAVVPLRRSYVEGLQTALLVLMGAVGFVLLIACANLANLLLARAAGRRHELAVRRALGATRGHLIRQLLAECLVVSVAGGLLGLLVALWGEDLLVRLGRDVLPSVAVISLDGPTFLFTAALTILSAFVFGLAPALQASRADVNDAMKEGGRGNAPGRHRLRSALVVAEVALSVTLLVGAGLLLRSFDRLLNTSPGFSPSHLLTAPITLPSGRYTTAEQRRAFFDALLERTQSLAGTVRGGAVLALPLSGTRYSSGFSIEGRPDPPPGQRTSVRRITVTPGYLRTMAIPLLKGRDFSPADDQSTPPVALLDAAMARHYWPTSNPLGQHIRLGAHAPWMTIIGIVGDVRSDSLDESGQDTVYQPFDQAPSADMTIVIRTKGDPLAVAGALRAQVAALDRDLPVGAVQTMDTLVAESAAPRRLNAIVVASFAVLALVLAAIGVYGVMSYIVAQRTQEIGIRMAIGATSTDIFRHVLGGGLRLVAIGLAAGLLGAALLSRALASLLFEVRPLDAPTFAGVSAVLLAVAAVAIWVPARRATRLDATVALRGADR